MTVGAVVDRHRLVVCVGTGGVGKTTVSAAIALGAARRGRRAMVLTIDPARALARALGVAALAPGGERVPLAGLAGTLDAGMLDQRQAWDAFVRRHAPDEAAAARILTNRFYRELSTSFAGATEYMAIEELCRLAESGAHDLIVLDTPPAGHALDFLRAPERLDPLLDRRLVAMLARPSAVAGSLVRFVLHRIERAAGEGTLRDLTDFFVALDALIDAASARTRRARALLRGGDAAFILVAGPRQLVLDETAALAARMGALSAPLAALVLNRVHVAPSLDEPGLARALAAVPDPAVAAWLRATVDDAAAEAACEADHVRRLASVLPAGLPHALIPELDRDVHALAELAQLSERLW